MNNALITDEQRIVLLANGRESLENPDFDPAPVVKLFTPDAGATWLLTEIDPDTTTTLLVFATWAWGRRKSAGSAWASWRSCAAGWACRSSATCLSALRSG